MNLTSHFLGITLKNKIFNELFESLKEYLAKNNIKNIIELQNLSSLHITLYYFGKKLDSQILANIKMDLKNLNKNIFSININQVNFFQKNSKNYLCYLSPLETARLNKINLILKNKYLNNVEDNNYSYIPHVTIFKIKNFSIYKDYEKDILSIINLHLEKIKTKDSFKEFNLYSVDSNHSPEEQKIIF